MENGVNNLHGRFNELIEKLHKLNNRLKDVTVSVCGHTLENVETSKESKVNEHLHDKVNTMGRLVNDIEVELKRLDGAVGSNVELKAAKVSY